MLTLSLVDVVVMSVFGGLGAAARFGLDRWLQHNVSALLSLGVINTLGSFALGLLGAILAHTDTAAGAHVLHTILGVGFLGGFTTFSSVALEVVKARDGGVLNKRRVYGTAGMLAAAVCALAAGVWIGGL